MLRYAIRRIAGVIPTLLVIVSASFFILRCSPGGPFDAEQTLSPRVRANLEAAYGLDRPVAIQYYRYLRTLAHGDFGPSLATRDFSVTDLIAQGLPVSASLGLAAIALALLIGVPAGMLAAVWHQTSVDVAITSLVVLGIALPG